MATAKKTAAKPTKSTAVATRSSGAVVDVKAMMAAQLARNAEKTQPASGISIRVTQDKQFALPDGTKTREPLRLVIVDFNSRNEFYPSAYDKDNITPPACVAIGDNPVRLIPLGNSPEKQADSCTECPNNVFGSAGAGKACKNSRMLVVLPPDAEPDTPLWTLKVSPTAIKGFDGYVNSLATRMGLAPFAVVTTVDFNEASDYPSLVFRDAEPLDDAGPFAARMEEAQKLLTAEPDFSGYGQEKPAAKKPAAKPSARPAGRVAATARR